MNLDVISSPIYEQFYHQEEAKDSKGQHKKFSLESKSGSTKDEKDDEDDKCSKSASKPITTMTDNKLKEMKSKRNSNKFNTPMIEDD